MVVLRLTVRGLSLISTLILVRLLDPADFGIVAMAMVVVAGIELFAAFGFDVTLIHKQDAGRAEYDTAWTISAILGFASAAAIALLAYPAAQLYDEPRLVPVFQVIAVASILEGLKNIGLVEFRKQLQLEKEFAFQVAVKLIGFVFTVSAAFWFRSYWALVLGILVTRLASLVLSYADAGLPPELLSCSDGFHFQLFEMVIHQQPPGIPAAAFARFYRRQGCRRYGTRAVFCFLRNLPASDDGTCRSDESGAATWIRQNLERLM